MKILKRAFAIMCILGICVNQVSPVQASDNDGITEFNSYKVEIDPYSLDDVKEAIIKYDIHERTAADMLAFSESCINGDGVKGVIEYYVPLGRATRTYTGYASRKYYEEVVNYSIKGSDIGKLSRGTVTSNYLSQTVSNVVKTLIGMTADYFTYNLYSIATALGNPAVGSSYEFGAQLIESKVKRYTYIYEGNSLSFGSLTESAQWYFKNYNNGVSKYSGYPAITKSKNFDSGYDQRAYYSYPNGGENQSIRSYTYYGTVFSTLL